MDQGRIKLTVRRFVDDEGGATAIEYALIIGLVFLVILASINAYGVAMDDMFQYIKAALGGAMGG